MKKQILNIVVFFKSKIRVVLKKKLYKIYNENVFK